MLPRNPPGARGRIEVFLHLQAPPLRVTGFDTPFPYTLEHEFLPDVGRIRDAVKQVMNY